MIRDGDFTIYRNTRIKDFCYDIIPDKTIDELKTICINDSKCLGFGLDGRLYFYTPIDKLIKIDITKNEQPNDIYLYRKRQSHYDSLSDDKIGNIPKIIHYIWFKKGRPFNIVNYIAIKTALKHNPTYKIYLHCDEPPDRNIYYDNLKDIIETKIIEVVTVINNKPVICFQHKADISRLRILEEFGGIYLDTDILLLKPLDEYIDKRFVIGYQNKGNTNDTTNAVIMVEPNNEMIKEWLEIYNISWRKVSPYDNKSIFDEWAGHSVALPYQLSYKYGYMMSIQDSKTFYPFLWTDYSIFGKEDNNMSYEESTCIHLWDTELYKTNLPPSSPHYFKRMNNAFTRLFKEYINDLPTDNQYHNNNFIKYEGYDVPNYDITFYGRLSIDELKWICNEIPNCIGFNTLGFMKRHFDKDKLVPTKGRPYCYESDSFYLKTN